jgi:hypothetical protein
VEALVAFDGKENHTDAILTGSREREAKAVGFADEELVRDLDEEASAVAGFRIAAARAAVSQVDENLNALLNNVMGTMTLDRRNKPDATRIVFIPRVIEPLGYR